MNATLSNELVNLGAGAVLVAALVTLWRRELASIVRALCAQGLALGGVALVLGITGHDAVLIATALVVALVKGLALPALLRRLVRRDPSARELEPLVNVPASLVAAAALIIVSYLVCAPVVTLHPAVSTRLAPIAMATVLIGFFLLATRRRVVSQVVGLLLVDNGIALAAFLLTSGVPLGVELGASLDVLLVVAVLGLVARSLEVHNGGVDLDRLRELHD